MNRVLIVLTDKYPYGSGETFIEAEREYWGLFDKVLICPVLLQPMDKIRESFVSRSHEVLVCTYEHKVGVYQMMAGSSGAISPIQMFSEIKHTQNAANLKTAIAMGVLSNLRYKRIISEIEKVIDNTPNDQLVIYSYWMYEPALVAVGIKKTYPNARFITRAHGYDLYEDRQPNGYVPFRRLVLDAADAVYPISENGKQYLSQKYQGKYDYKISVERLGTKRLFDKAHTISDSTKLVIVSCSNMVPLKRIDRIIEMLQYIKRDCEWFHFGDGELMDTLKKHAEMLPSNISVHFMGRVANQEVQKFYAEHYVDVFVNVSETEGVPVSIMEAQSYGIPVVATDVGGTSELVHSGRNGVLLNKDFSNEELLAAINDVLVSGDALRTNSRDTWQATSNAELIYDKLFQRELVALEQKPVD